MENNEEIKKFMEDNEKTLQEKPFERRAAKSVIISEKDNRKDQEKEAQSADDKKSDDESKPE